MAKPLINPPSHFTIVFDTLHDVRDFEIPGKVRRFCYQRQNDPDAKPPNPSHRAWTIEPVLHSVLKQRFPESEILKYLRIAREHPYIP